MSDTFYPVHDPDVQFNFDRIASLLIDTAGRKLKFRYGSATVPFGGAGTTGDVTVTHGVGSTPVVVFATYSSAASQGLFAYVNTIGTTTFTIHGVATAAPGSDQTCFWCAIG